MILSSADILKIIGGNGVIRLSAAVSITDGKPKLTGAEGIRIYIDRFPRVDEFQATWFIYIESDEDASIVIAELKRILPSVRVSEGLLTTVTTTDFLSDNTQRAPEAPKVQTTQVDLTKYEERFQELVEDVQDRMLLVNSGRPGKDGKDGLPGAPGRDGKDIDATNTRLEDLQNVETGIAEQDGQVLTLKNGKWTNLFVPQVMSAGGAVAGGSTNEPDDGLGGVISSFWKFNDNETESYNDGDFRVNSHQSKTDWSLTTEVYLAYKNDAGNSTKNYLLQLVKAGQYLYIQRKDDADAYAMFEVTANPVDADVKGARIEVAFVSQGTQISRITGGKTCGLTFALLDGSGGGGGGIEEAPIDGNYYLRRNATWVPNTSVPTDISSNTLGELSDVNSIAPSAGEALIYNGTVWAPGGDLTGGSF